ncbi:hypothetical protein RHMOL_Rhmol13G0287700 [Rhododendron molle]|uniref:Uncharacterized protein n=1 Tax=Rhododendron molle TaxID=49168 RepID=A0ACC0LC61_RHOML|nr:hypothetical protein RHMOL_Rhmol13G0287700 [Rhododendron molle]
MRPKHGFPSSNCLRLGQSKSALAISGIFLYLTFVLFFTKSHWPVSEFFSPLQQIFAPSQTNPPPHDSSPTNISHLVFGLGGSLKLWRHRKAYIESWWRPTVTRGYLSLDTTPTEEFLPWSAASPPFRVSDDISKIVEESSHVAPVPARMLHAILEVYREGDQGVRWYVMGDDDSIFFVDNWVNVLAKYDHTKYIYIGGHSETLWTNVKYSFDQGFGGGGFALSYPLVSAMMASVKFSQEKPKADITQLFVEWMQIDLKGDISGFLSSHPQAPLLSLHHLDKVAPIFPSMDRLKSLNHLMKSAKMDQSRLLQQTICYHKPTNWSFSVSWGYSAHIYEKVLPRSILKRPLETFRPWGMRTPPFYMFNTRQLPFKDPCSAPHVFFVKSVDNIGRNQIVSTFVRRSPRGLPTCSFSGNHSADYISMIRVLSPATKLIRVINVVLKFLFYLRKLCSANELVYTQF